ncbi:MAG TPA: hypothetical protein PLV03_01890 [Clostridiales bacterium]|nr:hypothetical protein [Clostridiales bacterium]
MDFTLEIKNPFERKWMTSYELPTFILNRFVKINDYNQAEIELICKQIIKLCAFIDNGYDNETIKAFFQAHLKKLGS